MLHLGSQDRRRTLFAHGPVLLAAFGLALVLGGCDGMPGTTDGTPNFSVELATETLNTGAVTVEEIGQGQYGDIVEGTQEVLRDKDAYASFWRQLHADQSSVPDRPAVDFDTQIVVAVVLGQRPTGGYGVEIDEVLATESGGQIQVRFTESVPGDECGTFQVLTSPYVLATVKTQGGDVTFSGSEETRPC
ncbi:MAG: protease complex subunit PrcB family protein [Salinibacter sp.]